jgi:CheY-like chemotaxis protein
MAHLRLLIAEDSQRDTELLVAELEQADYDVEYVRVETAEEFAATLEHGPWDLIISDHSMPHFNAPAALALLRQRTLTFPS